MLFHLCLLLCGALCVLAAPTVNVPSVDESSMPVKRDVSSSRLRSFNVWEQYAAAAYCRANNNSPNTQVACSVGQNCPLVEGFNSTTMGEFENIGFGDTTGFVALDHDNRGIIISLRGSTSVRNWLNNFAITMRPVWQWCPLCYVHVGFWNSFEDSRKSVYAAVSKALLRQPTYKIVVVGHSLGGAVGTLFAVDLRHQGFDVALYTFGAPHVGENFFANHVTSQAGGNYRFTHQNDLVPQLLIATGFLFRHWAPEYHITSDTGKTVKTTDIDVYDNVRYLPAGNLASFWPPNEAINAHGWYFDDIGKCYAQKNEW